MDGVRNVLKVSGLNNSVVEPPYKECWRIKYKMLKVEMSRVQRIGNS